jgi:hypothetical protein
VLCLLHATTCCTHRLLTYSRNISPFAQQADDTGSSDGGITDEENTKRAASAEGREGGQVGMEGREGQIGLDSVREIYRGGSSVALAASRRMAEKAIETSLDLFRADLEYTRSSRGDRSMHRRLHARTHATTHATTTASDAPPAADPVFKTKRLGFQPNLHKMLHRTRSRSPTKRVLMAACATDAAAPLHCTGNARVDAHWASLLLESLTVELDRTSPQHPTPEERKRR